MHSTQKPHLFGRRAQRKHGENNFIHIFTFSTRTARVCDACMHECARCACSRPPPVCHRESCAKTHDIFEDAVFVCKHLRPPLRHSDAESVHTLFIYGRVALIIMFPRVMRILTPVSSIACAGASHTTRTHPRAPTPMLSHLMCVCVCVYFVYDHQHAWCTTTTETLHTT